MRRSGISAVLVVGLLAGSTVAVTAQEGAGNEDPSATSIPIEELAFPSIPPSASGPSTFSWDAEQWDYTRDPETGRELRVLRIEATDPRAAGWAFTLDDRVGPLEGAPDYGILGSLANLSNDGGAWSGTWRGVKGDGAQGDFAELMGTDGYEGLAMYLFTLISGDVREGIGFIVPADAIPPFPQEDGPEQAVGRDAGTAPDVSLDALSDAEHYGMFLGHVTEAVPAMLATMTTTAQSLPTVTVEDGDYAGWFDEVLADPDAMAANLAAVDRFVAIFDEELAWLDAHPPRPCWAESHAAWRDWTDQAATGIRNLALALREEDLELLLQGVAEQEAFMGSAPPDLSSGQTCWELAE